MIRIKSLKKASIHRKWLKMNINWDGNCLFIKKLDVHNVRAGDGPNVGCFAS